MAAPVFALTAAAAGAGPGTVFGFLATIVGTVIDQFYILPKIFGEEDSAPSIGAVQANYAEEGAPLPYCRGANNRVSGNLVYMSTPFAVTRGGGGKRGGPAFETWYADVVVTTAYNTTESVDEILADGDLIYQQDPSHAAPSVGVYSFQTAPTFITLEFTSASSRQVWSYYPGYDSSGTGVGPFGAWFLDLWHMTVRNQRSPVVSRPELSQFTAGEDVTVTWGGAASIPVTRTLTVVESRIEGIDAATGQELNLLVLDLAPFWRQTVSGQRSRLIALTPTTSNNEYGPQNIATPGTAPTVALTAYPFLANTGSWTSSPGAREISFSQTGLQWQPETVDEALSGPFFGSSSPGVYPQTLPLYQSRLGPVNTPGLPSVSGFEFARLNLSGFGQRVPHFTFIVKESAAATFEDMVRWLAGSVGGFAGGLQASAYSTNRIEVASSTLATKEVAGLQFQGTTRPGQLLAQLLVAFDAVVEESRGVLRIKPNTERDVVVVDLDELDVRELGQPPTEPIRQLRDAARVDAPRRLNLRFPDVTNRLQWGNQQAIYDGIVDPATVDRTTRQMQLQIPMQPWEAFAVVRRLLRDQHLDAKRVELMMSLRRLRVTETDLLQIANYPIEGETAYVKLSRLEQGQDFRIRAEGVLLSTLPQSEPAADQALSGAAEKTGVREGALLGVEGAPLVPLTVIDVAPLEDQHADQHGVYVARPAGAKGVRLWSEIGDTNEWIQEGTIPAPAIMGTTTTKLGSGVLGVIDHSSTVTVRMFGRDQTVPFQSVTEAALAAGVNRAVIGDELVQFLTVTPGDPGVYTLTGMLRGLMATEDQLDVHAAGERFVFLGETPQFQRLNLAFFGSGRRFCATAPGKTPTLNLAINTKALRLASSMPLPPWAGKAYRNAASDIVVTWVRRSRVTHRSFGSASLPVPELINKYEVVFDPAGVAHVETATDAATVTYTAADQTSDGLLATDMDIWIYPVDSIRGRSDKPHKISIGTAKPWWLEEGGGAWLTEEGEVWEQE